MDRRAFKNLMTKRSSIWTLSLCLTGAVVLGGIALVDNTRDSADTQVETELNELAYLEEDYMGNTYGDEAEAETENMAAASGMVVEEAVDPVEENLDVTEESIAAEEVLEETSAPEVSEAVSDVYSDAVITEQALLDEGIAFSDENTLMWPSAGTILIDYSMDGTVYFPTLDQYKYNPALIIGSETGNQVIASAKGIVESIGIDEETGNTMVLNIGNGFKLTYGQLKELAVSEGDVVEQGTLLGYVGEPTKYYSTEGSNLYFAMAQNDEAVDPVLYLE